MAEEIFAEISDLIRNHTNRHVEAWKASGRPVIGYFCPYMPPEVILAAGALPLRFRGAGSQDSSLGDAYLSGRLCTYVRHVASLALDGSYDFLDGEISLNTCDHVRRAADVLVKKTTIPFHGFVSVPRSPREALFGYYRKELSKVLSGLAERFGGNAGDDALREAIRRTNRIRRRLAEIDRMRREERPRLSGAEALAVHIASQVLPPEVFVEIADRTIEALAARPGSEPPICRLVLVGAELDEPRYVEVIESQGGAGVADRLCFGSRAWPA